jgi:hypothetical protein
MTVGIRCEYPVPASLILSAFYGIRHLLGYGHAYDFFDLYVFVKLYVALAIILRF